MIRISQSVVVVLFTKKLRFIQFEGQTFVCEVTFMNLNYHFSTINLHSKVRIFQIDWCMWLFICIFLSSVAIFLSIIRTYISVHYCLVLIFYGKSNQYHNYSISYRSFNYIIYLRMMMLNS